MNDIQIKPIGIIERFSVTEEYKDRRLISKIIINKEFTKALEGIEAFSYIYVIFWMH